MTERQKHRIAIWLIQKAYDMLDDATKIGLPMQLLRQATDCQEITVHQCSWCKRIDEVHFRRGNADFIPSHGICDVCTVDEHIALKRRKAELSISN